MLLIAELQRRNVIRMAGLYLVGAWLITQVAGTVLPMFGAPDWVPRTVVIVLAIGFLPALTFAWVFELTPQGLKRDAEVPAEQSIAPQTAQRLNRLIIAVLALALAYFAVDKFVLTPRAAAALATAATAAPTSTAPTTRDVPSMGRQSIAVLPFVDLSAEQDQEYFSDGMAEEILNALAQVKDLKVAGRTSSFSYKGRNQDLRVIARELGVAHVLEGSVRKQGEKVRITAQLIQASDGSHLFSQTFDGDLTDVFELQENIARAITTKLQVALEGTQKSRLVPVATTSPEAYELYLQASAIFERRDGPNMPKAVRMLHRAITLDPKFARAQARLAVLYVVLPTYAGGQSSTHWEDVNRHARAAIALDASLAEPHAALGMAAGDRFDLAGEQAGFERALKLEPNDPLSNFWFGLNLARNGYIARGTKYVERTLQIDPLLPNAMRWRGRLLMLEGDLASAEPYLRRARAAGLVIVHRELADLAHRQGNDAAAIELWSEGALALLNSNDRADDRLMAEGLFGDAAARRRALAAIDRFLASEPTYVSGLLPLVLLNLGEPAKALQVLRKLDASDVTDISIALWTDLGKPIRALPEFNDFLQERGLIAYWETHGPPDLCVRKAPKEYVCK